MSEFNQLIVGHLLLNVKMTDTTSLIHVYCMPGMAAKPTIFEHLQLLPRDRFKMHWLSWIPPQKKEPIQHYAMRLCAFIKHKNPVLIGVSLGGVIVQEMQKFMAVKRLILISTVKTKYEMPPLMKWARKTRFYKILPTGLVKHLVKLKRLPFGKTFKKRIRLYEHYMGVDSKTYLNWAIEQMLFWDRETALPNLIHIHGDKDKIFPIRHIKFCYTVKGATHLLVVDRFRWLNDHLSALILS